MAADQVADVDNIGHLVHFQFRRAFFRKRAKRINFIGFPLGFYMAAQGSLIVFVVLIFWYSAKQNQIDEECGVAED